MGSRSARLALLLAVLAAVATPAASASVRFVGGAKYSSATRTADDIDMIVVHVTEGSFAGTVKWLRSGRSVGSSHYVVSKDGEVVQLVSVRNVAWHAGNSDVNDRSIGIEHEGYTFRGGFTEAEYRASAQLVVDLAQRYGIPLDRRHIIGHNEVPNPAHPGRFGGIHGHEDPGKFFDWAHYMELIRMYAAGEGPGEATWLGLDLATLMFAMPAIEPVSAPATPASDTSWSGRAVVDHGATVHGSALWWSGITRERARAKRIYKVTFLVDGNALYTDHTWPFSFRASEGWDTTSVGDGDHTLVVRGYRRNHAPTTKTVHVVVANDASRAA